MNYCIDLTKFFEIFHLKLKRWCQEAGGDINIKTLERGVKQIPTRVDDSNPFWVAFKNGANEA